MPHRVAKEKLSFIEKIKQGEPIKSYRKFVKGLSNEALQATRDTYRAPYDKQPGSMTYEQWIKEDRTRDVRGLEALKILKSEIATRNYRASKGMSVGPMFYIEPRKGKPPVR